MWGVRLRQRGDALALAVAMEGDGEARGGERGLYTLLVEDGAGRPVMYRQVSAEGVFTVPAPRSGDSYAIHFLNNRWIGMDQEIVYGHAAQAEQATVEKHRRKQKPRKEPREKGHPEIATNQDEIDLLSFISWEDDGMAGNGVELDNSVPNERKPASQSNPVIPQRKPPTVSSHLQQPLSSPQPRTIPFRSQLPVSTSSQSTIPSNYQQSIPSSQSITPYNPQQSIPSLQPSIPSHTQQPTPQTPPNINVDAFLNTLFQYTCLLEKKKRLN